MTKHSTIWAYVGYSYPKPPQMSCFYRCFSWSFHLKGFLMLLYVLSSAWGLAPSTTISFVCLWSFGSFSTWNRIWLLLVCAHRTELLFHLDWSRGCLSGFSNTSILQNRTERCLGLRSPTVLSDVPSGSLFLSSPTFVLCCSHTESLSSHICASPSLSPCRFAVLFPMNHSQLTLQNWSHTSLSS